MKIGIGADHAGFEFKTAIIQYLEKKGLEIHDFGTESLSSVDYPDYIHPLCIAIENKQCDMGVIICGSGNGVAITANKHQNIRAALCWENEIAALSRMHNDANIIALPARFITLELAETMIETFLTTVFEGGRHQNRVNKISIC
jgi:ribose 5-phosphate isomerase B